MAHLLRPALLLLAILGVTLMFIAIPRLVSVPEALEDYGFYGEGDNSNEWADWPEQYAASSTCRNCHTENYNLWVEGQHDTVVCENCHGPGNEHIAEGVSLIVDDSRELCGLCHARVVARPSDFPQVDLAEHGAQSACTNCHNPHTAAFRIAQLHPIPHGKEGRENCTSCHGTERMVPFPRNHKGFNKNTCLNCHEGR